MYVIMVFAIQLIAFALGFHLLLSNNDNFITPKDTLLKNMHLVQKPAYLAMT